jgi:hypothetical protein
VKIKDYSRGMPIILGDFGVEPKAMKTLSDGELISMQEPSTQRALKRDPKEDEAWWARPLPEEKEWKRDYKVHRKLDPQEVVHYQAHRMNREHKSFYRKDKTSLISERNIKGDITLISLTPQTKQKAMDAFRFTPPAKVTPEQVLHNATNLVEYKSEPIQEKWVELKWYQAFWHWLKGGRVEQIQKDELRWKR